MARSSIGTLATTTTPRANGIAFPKFVFGDYPLGCPVSFAMRPEPPLIFEGDWESFERELPVAARD
jgi:hypothetical protein